MSRTNITHATVVLPDRLLEDYSVIFQDGKIRELAPAAGLRPDAADELVDAQGNYLAPGFVDLHMHGMHRHLVDNGSGALSALCELLPRCGVTGFLPTVLPRPKGEDAALLASLAKVRSRGAAILGFHLEGPFLTLTGALPPEALGKADADRVVRLIDAARPHRAIFSISPDFEGILNLIPLMEHNDTPVFMTHTAANVEQTEAAIAAGARHATHFYNVFPCPPLVEEGVRPCGAIEAILADPRVTVDFILDGEHVHPVAVRMALQCKGWGGVCLITDANVGAGLAPGCRYRFGAYEVTFAYEGGPARMTENGPLPGALAGSGLTMDRAVRNAMRMLRIDLPQAIRMASTNPAAVAGYGKSKGWIRAGFDADLVLLDKELMVKRTWVEGELRFANE